MRKSIRIVMSFMLVGCADAAAPAADGGAQQLRLSTMPDASCMLRALDAERGGMPLRSNHSGRVTFDVRRVPSHAARPLLQLDCVAANGARDSQRLDLELLLQAASAPEPLEATRIRPALDRDLATVTQRELDLGGYPRRPNAPEDSDDYQRWVAAVSMPMRVLTFGDVPSALKLDDQTSGNWCGAIATSGAYEYVYGGWVEPHLSADENITETGSIWLGLGGTNQETLLQAGTLQRMYATEGFEFQQHQVVREVVPMGDQGAHVCDNCQLDEGDRVQFSARIESPDGNGSGTAVFYYWNVTRAEMASVEVPFDGNFSGATAEWIMEDPSQAGISLPEFGTVDIDGMQTYSAATDYIPFGASESHTVGLRVNDHDYCKADVTSDTSISTTRLPN